LYRDGVEIPEEIIEYVARNIKSNVRELEVNTLIAQSLSIKEVTIELAKVWSKNS
jgi:chromosomal replication initiator protein